MTTIHSYCLIVLLTVTDLFSLRWLHSIITRPIVNHKGEIKHFFEKKMIVLNSCRIFLQLSLSRDLFDQSLDGSARSFHYLSLELPKRANHDRNGRALDLDSRQTAAAPTAEVQRRSRSNGGWVKSPLISRCLCIAYSMLPSG